MESICFMPFAHDGVKFVELDGRGSLARPLSRPGADTAAARPAGETGEAPFSGRNTDAHDATQHQVHHVHSGGGAFRPGYGMVDRQLHKLLAHSCLSSCHCAA